MSPPSYDLVVANGLVFDGAGAPPHRASVAIKDGVVAAIEDSAELARHADQVIDASGTWVMPGFLDQHTHYDAEVEAAPGLTESLRHGVTTVVVGSCSLGTALSEPVDVADMFTRVEAMPRASVLPLFERAKSWHTPAEYRAHLEGLPLGPNVAAFLGHSDLRCHVMGLGRAVTAGERPSAAEVDRMAALVDDALAAGFLGLSTNTNRWDKLGGSRYRSQPLPSTFARWREIRRLTDVVRRRGRVLQGIPNISAKYDLFLFLAESIGLGRRPLKTSLVSMVDVRSNRLIYKALGALARLANRVLRADVRYQALPMRFEMFVDGLDAPIFEELGAGTMALHLEDLAERRTLLGEAAWRKQFRRQWTSKLAPKVFHRDFRQSRIVACPDPTVVGKSIAEVAAERGHDVVEAFVDLCVEHGDQLRWFTTIGNDRPAHLRRIMAHPDTLPGFSDAGAHLRNMAFYNFPLALLRMAQDGAAAGDRTLTVERAVHRLTGELADWIGVDAGHLVPGARADLAVIDPRHLGAELDELHEAAMPEFDGFRRMVRRNDAAVPAVVVGGRLAVHRGVPVAAVGRERGFGRFLPARA